jgi:hypothetical protein
MFIVSQFKAMNYSQVTVCLTSHTLACPRPSLGFIPSTASNNKNLFLI